MLSQMSLSDYMGLRNPSLRARNGGQEEKWWTGSHPWCQGIVCPIRIFQVRIE